MGSDLAKREPRNLANLGQTPSLPEWLQRSLSGLGADFMPAIPQRLAPTEAQRAEIKRMIRAIDSELGMVDDDNGAAYVTKLLAAFPAAHMSPSAAEGRADAFLMAIEGLPLWAIVQACRRWIRGEVEGMNPAFAPTPPQLRNLALAIMAPMRATRHALTRLLNARVEIELPDEQRKANLDRLAGILREMDDAAQAEERAHRDEKQQIARRAVADDLARRAAARDAAE